MIFITPSSRASNITDMLLLLRYNTLRFKTSAWTKGILSWSPETLLQLRYFLEPLFSWVHRTIYRWRIRKWQFCLRCNAIQGFFKKLVRRPLHEQEAFHRIGFDPVAVAFSSRLRAISSNANFCSQADLIVIPLFPGNPIEYVLKIFWRRLHIGLGWSVIASSGQLDTQ